MFPGNTHVNFTITHSKLGVTGMGTTGKKIGSGDSCGFGGRAFPGKSIGNFCCSAPSLGTAGEAGTIVQGIPSCGYYVVNFSVHPCSSPGTSCSFGSIVVGLATSPMSTVGPRRSVPIVSRFAPSRTICNALTFRSR